MIINKNNTENSNYSFVHEELYKLINIPHEFDEEFYKKISVGTTTVNYWKSIGYTPPYYYMFWLFMKVCRSFTFEEYREIRDSLISGIIKENDKIGTALKDYAINENNAYKEFIRNDGKYMYFLSNDYGDGSGEELKASIYYDEILSKINDEVMAEKNNSFDMSYWVNRFPLIMSNDQNDVVGIDVVNGCGQFVFNSKGDLNYIDIVNRLNLYDMEYIDLFDPYLFIPHPFKKGDIVEYYSHGQYVYGVLYYAADIDEREEIQSYEKKDGSDFTATVISLYKDWENNTFKRGHDHICPVYLEALDLEEGVSDDLKEALLTVSTIIKKYDENTAFEVLSDTFKSLNDY